MHVHVYMYLSSYLSLRFQVSELSNKLSARDAEFDAYRQQILGKTESTLQAELTMLHLEKVSRSVAFNHEIVIAKHCYAQCRRLSAVHDAIVHYCL